nr:RNA polymerase sigma-70 factor [uncultured Pedobacter sp.]
MEENSLSHKIHFERLFKEFYGKLIFFANRYLNDMEAAEEQVSIVFSKLWENKSRYPLEQLSTAFIFTMTKNACISYLRHKKIENEYISYLQKNKLLEQADNFEEQILETKEFRKYIFQAIENLPPRCREVFKLSRFEKKMNREIAESLNISVKTVERQMTIALDKLRFQLSHFLTLLVVLFFS